MLQASSSSSDAECQKLSCKKGRRRQLEMTDAVSFTRSHPHTPYTHTHTHRKGGTLTHVQLQARTTCDIGCDNAEASCVNKRLQWQQAKGAEELQRGAEKGRPGSRNLTASASAVRGGTDCKFPMQCLVSHAARSCSCCSQILPGNDSQCVCITFIILSCCQLCLHCSACACVCCGSFPLSLSLCPSHLHSP